MAKVLFKRIEDSTNIDNIDIEDGAFIITKDGKTYVDYDETRVRINGTPDAPVGAILPYAGINIPDGWLLCDGSEISRNTYSYLYWSIRDTYGAGDGTTTFNLPNLSGRVIVGLNTNDTDFDELGKTGGSKELQQHTHKAINYVGGYTGGSQSGLNTILAGSSIGTTPDAVKSAGTGNSGNLQPYITLKYIIKY